MGNNILINKDDIKYLKSIINDAEYFNQAAKKAKILLDYNNMSSYKLAKKYGLSRPSIIKLVKTLPIEDPSFINSCA